MTDTETTDLGHIAYNHSGEPEAWESLQYWQRAGWFDAADAVARAVRAEVEREYQPLVDAAEWAMIQARQHVFDFRPAPDSLTALGDALDALDALRGETT